jgi:hypothetical protein
MTRRTIGCLAVLLLGFSQTASAELFAIEGQGQAGYSRLSNLALPGSTTGETATLAGLSAGARGRLQILFLNAMVDYQHFFDGADFLHAGLGVSFSTDILPAIKPYVQASAGVLVLSAKGESLGPQGTPDLAETGFMARAGGGIEVPFAGDFLAAGVSADIGLEYITGKVGYSLSVMGYLGLRI